jgi:hypothetical protein
MSVTRTELVLLLLLIFVGMISLTTVNIQIERFLHTGTLAPSFALGVYIESLEFGIFLGYVGRRVVVRQETWEVRNEVAGAFGFRGGTNELLREVILFVEFLHKRLGSGVGVGTVACRNDSGANQVASSEFGPFAGLINKRLDRCPVSFVH